MSVTDRPCYFITQAFVENTRELCSKCYTYLKNILIQEHKEHTYTRTYTTELKVKDFSTRKMIKFCCRYIYRPHEFELNTSSMFVLALFSAWSNFGKKGMLQEEVFHST